MVFRGVNGGGGGAATTSEVKGAVVHMHTGMSREVVRWLQNAVIVL
jgi:hypothetical protein